VSLVSVSVGVSSERAEAARVRLQRRLRWRRGVLEVVAEPRDGGYGVAVVVSRPVDGVPVSWRGVPVRTVSSRQPRAL
jgi:hypothetical protein